MEAESIVYGCIHEWVADSADEQRLRRTANREALEALPAGDCWPLLGREMFSFCTLGGLYQTQVIHFGASYQTVEYEWALWMQQFEALLGTLYWTRAVAHLQTESNGLHTFRWEAEAGFHDPLQRQPRLRCAWEREH